jgi:hypothetical protein
MLFSSVVLTMELREVRDKLRNKQSGINSINSKTVNHEKFQKILQRPGRNLINSTATKKKFHKFNSNQEKIRKFNTIKQEVIQ